MAARKYSDEQLNEAAELREAGMSLGAIAKRLGMSSGAVNWHCLRLGADTPQRSKRQPQGPMVMQRSGHTVRRFTPDEDRKIREMAQQGAGASAIARSLGRKHNSIIGRLMTLARQEARNEEA